VIALPDCATPCGGGTLCLLGNISRACAQIDAPRRASQVARSHDCPLRGAASCAPRPGRLQVAPRPTSDAIGRCLATTLPDRRAAVDQSLGLSALTVLYLVAAALAPRHSTERARMLSLGLRGRTKVDNVLQFGAGVCRVSPQTASACGRTVRVRRNPRRCGKGEASCCSAHVGSASLPPVTARAATQREPAVLRALRPVITGRSSWTCGHIFAWRKGRDSPT